MIQDVDYRGRLLPPLEDNRTIDARSDTLACPNEFTILHVFRNYQAGEEDRTYSPWTESCGFRWRLFIYPRGNETPDNLSLYLECGGRSDALNESDEQMIDSASNENSTNGTSTSSWKCPARFTLTVVHPTRWSEVGVNLADLGDSTEQPLSDTENGNDTAQSDNNSEVSSSEADGPSDITREVEHIFSETERDWGFCEFVELSTLRPELHCDDNFNLVIRVHVTLEKFSGSEGLEDNIEPILGDSESRMRIRLDEMVDSVLDDAVAVMRIRLNEKIDSTLEDAMTEMRTRLHEKFDSVSRSVSYGMFVVSILLSISGAIIGHLLYNRR